MGPNADDEIVQEYLAECREHLATIETDLLVVEERGENIDEEVVNRVFRAAHSIKGGAGFFDLTQIRDLAHKTENVLDLIRSRRMTPTTEVVNVLLLAFDKLRELIQNHAASNQADISGMVEGLVRLTSDHLPAAQKHTLDERVSIPMSGPGPGMAVPVFDLKRARERGRCVYLIECDLIHDIQRKGKTPYEMIRRLMASGTILETVFNLDSAGTLEDEPSSNLMLGVLYASDAGPEQIAALLELSPEQIRVVDCSAPEKEPDRTAPAEVPAAEAPIEPAPIPAPPHGAPAAAPAAADSTIRLNVSLLDSLMTLAGELVLSRNQLNESLSRQDERGIRSGAQRVSMVTSEIQEVVSLTRMQPVGTLFSKLPRLVRDLARELGKEAQLKIEGGEVELDKTILEGLSDPLTHMVRNAVDHGIEPPEFRAAHGKPRSGTVLLKASHQAGQVVIEISDDGRGLDVDRVVASSLARGVVTREQLQAMSEREKTALILLPGVSTAAKVSDVSGRGVGMDVVKTNLDRLGGKMEIESGPGAGTSFRIKLPLTLAIIPSLLISDGDERFAIPQVNVSELIRIPPAQLAKRIDRVGDADVLILRDRLVPLIGLSGPLAVGRADAAGRARNVVLVDTGVFEYGLVVEELHDTAEIVVKPLGGHLRGLPDYAGATILGDGCVALILDVAGLAARAGLSAAQVSARRVAAESGDAGEVRSLLLFRNAPEEQCAVPLERVSRIERIRSTDVEYVGGRRTMQYRDASLPLVALADTASVGQLGENQSWIAIVYEHGGRPLGLLASEPLDMIETALVVDRRTLRQQGIAGSAVLRKRTTLLVDLEELAAATQPAEAAREEPAGVPAAAAAKATTVLVAEDSEFFRGQLRRLLEGIGCNVLAAADGQAAWELLDQHAGEVGLVTTDIEMPHMDGLALARRIRADARFRHLPVIAVSTLAADEEVARGLAAGINEYQVKLNQEDLIRSVRRVVDQQGEERR